MCSVAMPARCERFGFVALGGESRLNHQLALLFGLDDDAADQTLRLVMEYEI